MYLTPNSVEYPLCESIAILFAFEWNAMGECLLHSFYNNLPTGTCIYIKNMLSYAFVYFYLQEQHTKTSIFLLKNNLIFYFCIMPKTST